MSSSPHLSVVVPARNEEDRLARSLPLIDAYLRDAGIRAEILVVDDGSTDGTSLVATRVLQGRPGRVVRQPANGGKGAAVRRGFAEATGRWVLVTDADLSTPIEEHARLAAVARDRDLDIVIGSRGLPDSRVEKRQPFLRDTMGRTFGVASRSLTGLPFRDTQCGFKLLHRDRTAPIFAMMRVDGFAWDVELLFLAVRFGLAVGEVPVTWRDDERSSVRLLTDPWRMLFDVVRLRWNFRVGVYDPTAVRAGKATRP